MDEDTVHNGREQCESVTDRMEENNGHEIIRKENTIEKQKGGFGGGFHDKENEDLKHEQQGREGG